MHLPRVNGVQRIANGNSISRRAAASIRFKCHTGSLIAQTVKRGWHSRRLEKTDQYAGALPFSCPLCPAAPDQEKAVSLSLAQLSRQLNIGIDFQSSGSVCPPGEPPRRLCSSHCDRATTLQCYSFVGASRRPGRSIRSIPRQLCAESGAASRSCRNL